MLSSLLKFLFLGSSCTESNVHDPRALAAILEKAEEELAHKRHPDPYIRASSKPTLPPFSPSLTIRFSYSLCIPGRHKVVRVAVSVLSVRRFADLSCLGLLATRRERNMPVCNSFVPSCVYLTYLLVHTASAWSHL